jgi:PAS domain S-box-containing protein
VSGRTTFANQRLAELLEYTPEELRQRYPEDFADGPCKQAVRDGLARAQSVDKLEVDWFLRSKQQKQLNTIVRIASLYDSGTYAGAVLTVLDVTERNRLQAQLAQADHMASLGVLAAGVGHEINNPLTYVLSSLDEIETSLSAHSTQSSQTERDELLQCAREALDGARRVRDIVQDLRTFTRVEDSGFVAVDVHRAIDSALNMVGRQIRFRARLIKEYGSVSKVLGDPARLSQVFLNLLVNATHAITEGGVDDNEIRICTWQTDSSVVVEVGDTGHGVPADARERLFDPFFTTKLVGHGSGLGLWICHQTITSHGGTIEVDRQPRRGAVFRVKLPVVRASGVWMATTSPLLPQSSAPKGRALVIDDEVLLRRAFERTLKHHYDLVLAESAERAMAIVTSDRAFDLILCDLMMPGMSGMDWFAWLQAWDSELAARVIFVTGGAVTPQAREFVAHTSNPVISKPFESKDILRVALGMQSPIARDRRSV